MAKTKKVIKETIGKGKALLKKKTAKLTKKSAAAAEAPKKTKAVKTEEVKTCKEICIDYPQNNETVFCGHYCFRIGSLKEVPYVRVSINGSPWQDCRQACGYWWFDWWNFQTGSFTLEATSLVDGKVVKTAKRKFKVTL